MPDARSLILASASPRRRDLLHQIGVPHEVRAANIDERVLEGEAPAEYVLRVALAKVRAVAGSLSPGEPRPVLAADTAVVVDQHILGKPAGREEGLQQLRLLSGRDHEVITGVALSAGGRVATRLSVSHVHFRPLSDAEISAYWETGEPADKAGSYGIQGLAAAFITAIRGSYSGIMGLPLYETAELLGTAGHAVLAGQAAA